MKTIATLLALLASTLVQAEVINIDANQLEQLRARGVPLVDVRTAPEWRQSGIVEGSHTMTFFDARGRADPRRWMEQLSAIAGPDDELIVICHSGRRSARVSNFLDDQMKYRKVYNVRGGIVSWKSQGRPTVSP